jgi:hypothetical protein
MSPKVTHRAALALLAAGVLTAPVFAAKRLEGIPLVWKPTNPKDHGGVVNLVGIGDVKIQVMPFVDTRPDKAKFGENQEDRVFKPVTTSGSISDFCTQNFENTLKQLGLTVVAEGGDVVVGAEILEFMVIETNTYNGVVRLKVSVKRNGKTTWVGLAYGTSSHFGRSYKDENYYETISDSLLEAALRTASDEGFRKALLSN